MHARTLSVPPSCSFAVADVGGAHGDKHKPLALLVSAEAQGAKLAMRTLDVESARCVRVPCSG